MNIITSPIYPLIAGYGFLIFGAIILYYLDFFIDNSFFRWGPPVTIMGHLVDDYTTFYVLMAIFCGHQAINSWNSKVVYPYIVNEIQDRKCLNPSYGIMTSLSIAFFFDNYSMLDMVFLINGSFVQVSFLIAIMITNSIITILVNYIHILKKEYGQIY